MEILNTRVINQFIDKEPKAQAPLNFWVIAVKAARWITPADILSTFNTADGVGNNKYIFNIGGNNYRLVAMVWLKNQKVYVLKVMTHAEYDKEKFQ